MTAVGVCMRCHHAIERKDLIVKRFEYRGEGGRERFKSLDLAYFHRTCAWKDWEDEARRRDDRLVPGRVALPVPGQEAMEL